MCVISDDEEQLNTRRDYGFKLINPARKKTDYRIYNIRNIASFTNMERLRQFIMKNFKEFSGYDGDMSIGYVQPGHGWKGKQSWLNNDDDLKELYEVCGKVKLIHIWCYLPAADRGAKRKQASAPNLKESSQSKRSKIKAANEVKADEAKTILEKLKIKHGDKYTPEQFQNWSDLIQLKKCTDDEPPDLPFFRGCKKKAEIVLLCVMQALRHLLYHLHRSFLLYGDCTCALSA